MNRWSIALFRLFGIRLEVHATFLLLLTLAGYDGWRADGAAGAAWEVVFVGLMFGCVVLHELGHALAALRYGIRASRILLLPIGGMAQFDSLPRQPGRELVIALAGPAVNYLLIGLIVAGFGWPPALGDVGLPTRMAEIPHALLLINLMMGVFNLLPAFPMDGGRVLRALLALRFGHARATRWAARSGQVIALVCGSGAIYASVFLGYNLWMVAALFAFIGYGAEMEYRLVRNENFYAGLAVGDVTRSDFLAFHPDTTVAAALEALRRTVPQDLLLISSNGPVGIVTRARIAAAIRAGCEHEPLAQHATHDFLELHAEGALGTAARDIVRRSQQLFPVYSFGRLIGVCDTRHLEESVRLLRLRPPGR
jgi:Zn-dependent protease